MPEYMIFVVADPITEGNEKPDCGSELYAKVDALNKEMTAAGVFVDAGGFTPTRDSYRLKFNSGSEPQVLAGPFDVAVENHVSGFWRVKVKDADEVLQWAKKIPFRSGEVILRKMSRPDTCGAAEDAGH